MTAQLGGPNINLVNRDLLLLPVSFLSTSLCKLILHLGLKESEWKQRMVREQSLCNVLIICERLGARCN